MAYLEMFKISPDGKKLRVAVKPDSGATLTSIKLWTEKNYKSSSDFHNFSELVNNLGPSQGLTFTISPEEVGKGKFDGLYFIEVQDSMGSSTPCSGCQGPAIGVATDFTRFSFCLLEYLCGIDPQCVSCDIELHKALTMKLYIDGLRNSIQLGKFTTAITFWKNLNRACKSECVECQDLSAIAKKGLGFHTLGGNLILY